MKQAKPYGATTMRSSTPNQIPPFQGRITSGKVKLTTEDNTYCCLNQTLKEALETLAQKIAERALLICSSTRRSRLIRRA
jgi:hypothetical protein